MMRPRGRDAVNSVGSGLDQLYSSSVQERNCFWKESVPVSAGLYCAQSFP